MAKPPLGVMPAWLWNEQHPRPSLEELRARLAELEAAAARYRAAEIVPPPRWLGEISHHARALALH